ncbi:hypothetical protein DPSP01_013869 [Paraphaeosphaeria sporulosa]
MVDITHSKRWMMASQEPQAGFEDRTNGVSRFLHKGEDTRVEEVQSEGIDMPLVTRQRSRKERRND